MNIRGIKGDTSDFVVGKVLYFLVFLGLLIIFAGCDTAKPAENIESVEIQVRTNLFVITARAFDPMGFIDFGDGTKISFPGHNGYQRYVYEDSTIVHNVKIHGSLYHLAVEGDDILQLDVTNNPSLGHLQFRGYSRETIDLSENKELILLAVVNSQLRHLDLSSNQYLDHIGLTKCQFSSEDLNSLFHTLHNNNPSIMGYFKYIFTFDNPGSEFCDVSIAESKGWTVYNDPGLWGNTYKD